MIEKQFGILIYPMWREKATAFNPDGPVSAGELVAGVVRKALHPTDQNPVKYVHDVRIELERIVRSQAGRALASALRYYSEQWVAPQKGEAITIMPYEVDSCNAEESSTSRGARLPVVLFSPAARATLCSKGGAASLPHESLYHELIHALRMISGHFHRYRVAGQMQPFGNSEEFLAVLATNIFISDLTNHHKSKLRANHESHREINHELSDSFRFFSLGFRVYNNIAIFCNENPVFTKALANVRAPFNPIAAYYKNQRKAFDIAAQGDAEAYFSNDLIPLDFYQLAGGNWTRTNPDSVSSGKAVVPAASGR